MYRCHDCQTSMELRKSSNATLWRCARCEHVAGTIANWSETGVTMDLLRDIIESSRGIRDTGRSCPTCATSMTPVVTADLRVEVCKACRVVVAPDGSAMIPKTLSAERTQKDIEAQRELSLAYSQLQMTERTPELGDEPEVFDESGLLLDAIPWFTGALIIGGWLGLDVSGQGLEVHTWAFFPETPWRQGGLPILLHPLLHARVELLLLYTVALGWIGHQLEYRVARRELALLAGSTAVVSGLLLILFSAQGALIGLGGVCTALVTLHSKVAPHPYVTFKNYNMHTSESALRTFVSPLVKMPLFLAYMIVLCPLMIGPIAHSFSASADPNTSSILTLITPHIVGIVLASLWLRRLPEEEWD